VAPVQPGGRAAAPGDLALVQAFINSFYDLERDHGADLFATPAALVRWLTEHGLLDPDDRAPRTSADCRRAIAVREALRELARGSVSSVSELNAGARGAAVEVRFSERGPSFVPAGGGGLDGAIGVVLAITATAMSDGSWPRLKICPGHDCGWAFYDHSRNLSGRWCSMTVCGGRAKARAYYRRRKEVES
jgi:predicted RNA-binding Zn ribbon-like protein